MTANQQQQKLGAQPFLIVLGVISTSLLAVFSIQGDDEIQIRKHKIRQVASTNHVDALGKSLYQVLSKNWDPTLCKHRSKIFSSMTIAKSRLHSLPQDRSWEQEHPEMEQEALRRCQGKQAGLGEYCLVFHPESQSIEDGYLAADKVLMELNIKFRSPITRTNLPCSQAIQHANSQMLVYYTLYWNQPGSSSRGQKATGGYFTMLNPKQTSLSQESPADIPETEKDKTF